MFMAPIKPRPPDYRVVRMLRRWAAEREAGGMQLPSLVQFGQSLGLDPQAAIALASMFQLTEHCLGRPLEPECCCSQRLTRDERAVLLMIATAASRPPLALASMPHGLPGALSWAVESVRRFLCIREIVPRAAPARCPFG